MTGYHLVQHVLNGVFPVIGLVLLAPVLLVASLAIMLESPGGPIYRQQRVGRSGRHFQMLKLRTMQANAETDGEACWAGDPDPRVTRVGSFLRRSRLDEVPQLWNVLRGEMSLIGPRPERPEFVAQLAQRLPLYDTRHLIKPGITGWAQVNYGYAASVADTATKLKYDLYYVQHRCTLLDIIIVLRTVQVMLILTGR